MPDVISDGSEFSCNFCTSKLKLKVISCPSSVKKAKGAVKKVVKESEEAVKGVAEYLINKLSLASEAG